MTKYRDIIKSPIITEKSSEIANSGNKYVFKVDPKVNKTEVKQAIEKIFNVKVEKVNLITVHPREKKVGRYSGFTNKYKKAIVTLKENNKIEF